MGRIAGKPAFTSLKKLLRPFVIDTLGDALTTAKLGNALLATESVQYNADLFFS